MKKLITLLIVSVLILAYSAVSPAAIHYANSPLTDVSGIFGGWCCNSFFLGSKLADMGNWFSIEPVEPYYGVNLHLSDNVQYGGSYYLNDQTFIEAYIGDNDCAYGHNTRFAGSYKFENGIFAGIDFRTIPYDYEGMAIISPGYAFNLGGNGYIALSGDYAILFSEGDYDMDYTTDKGFVATDLDFAYKGERFNIYGQIYMCNQELNASTSYVYTPEAGDYYDFGMNFAVTDTFTVGADLNSNNYDNGPSEHWYKLGGTYKADNGLTVDARYNFIEEAYDKKWEFAECMITYAFSDKLTAGLYLTNQGEDYIDYFYEDVYFDRGSGLVASYQISDTAKLNLSLQVYEPTVLDVGYVVKF